MADEPMQEPEESLRNQRFQRAMALTPRPVLTPFLIAINVAVFLIMLAKGFDFSHPSAESYLPWGADFGPSVTHGEWWRVVTATFLHANFIHLLMNMLILWSIGSFTERLFGRVAFLVLYMLAGVGGNLVSLFWQPFTVAMGASGAIFGLYGGMLGLLLLHRHTVPRPYLLSIAKSAAIFLGINLAYGLTQSNVDVAAHIGGLAAGFLLGLGLTGPLVPADPDWRQRRSFLVALGGVALAVVCFHRLPVSDDWRSDVNRLISLDTSSQQLYNQTVGNLQAHKIGPAEFAAVIDQKLLPPWDAERQNLIKLKLPPKQRAIADRLAQYMALRSEAWSLMKTGVAHTDPTLVRQSYGQQAAAAAVLQNINREFAQTKGTDH